MNLCVAVEIVRFFHISPQAGKIHNAFHSVFCEYLHNDHTAEPIALLIGQWIRALPTGDARSIHLLARKQFRT